MGYELSLSLNTKLTGIFIRHLMIKQGNYVNDVYGVILQSGIKM